MTLEHDQLLQIVKEKTNLIKKDEIETFQKLLMRERKQIQAISQLEAKRIQITEALFNEMNIVEEEKTVTILLQHMKEGQEKTGLEASVAALIDRIVDIRSTEQLNKELIQQSMQFVQLSLDMLQPNMQQMNYNQHSISKSPRQTSVFDSKA